MDLQILSVLAVLAFLHQGYTHDCPFAHLDFNPQPLPSHSSSERILQTNATNYNLTIADELTLQSQGNGIFKGMRISWDTTTVTSNLTTSKKDHLLNKILPFAKQYFKSFLKVNPFPTKILIPKPANNEVCGSFVAASEVDQRLFVDGWFDTDMLFFVKAINDPQSSFAAVATACFYYPNQFNRPVIGMIMINGHFFDSNSYVNGDRHLILHEMMHALGFANNLFPLYRFDNGTLRGSANVM